MTRRELAAYRPRDTGALPVRELLDSFTKPAGEYQCAVHKPLRMSMETLKQLSPGRKVPENLLKAFLVHLLKAPDFLHTGARIIHAGMKHLP